MLGQANARLCIRSAIGGVARAALHSRSRAAFWLRTTAHAGNGLWNRGTRLWDRRALGPDGPTRRALTRGNVLQPNRVPDEPRDGVAD